MDLCRADSALRVQDYSYAQQLYTEVIDQPFASHLQLLRANVGMMFICQQLSRNKDYYYFKTAAHRHISHLTVPEQLDSGSTVSDSLLYETHRRLILVEAIYLHNMREITESRQLLKSIGLAAVSRQSLLSLYLGSSSLYMRSLRATMAADHFTAQGDYAAALDSLAFALSLINSFDRQRNARDFGDSLTLCPPDSLAPNELLWIADTTRIVVPEWIAAVRSQLSITYGVMGLKAESDCNHNIYLDILEATRVDRQPEHEYDDLCARTARLRFMLFVLVSVIVIVILLAVVFSLPMFHRYRYRHRIENINEKYQLDKLSVEKEKRGYIERVAALGIAQGIAPFLDRAVNEVDRRGASAYLIELIDHISQLNTLLGHWIQMRRGNVAITVSSFSLSDLFATLAKSVPLYRKAGITLTVVDTTCRVRADRDLTLFMLNTLLDNARRYTPSGGNIIVAAQPDESAGYVDISVTDTGCGFEPQSLTLDSSSSSLDSQSTTPDPHFGFGLHNCRSIIEQYKKHSRHFALCRFDVESSPDAGSRFTFRLPLAVRSLLLFLSFGLTTHAQVPLPAVVDSIVSSNLRADYRQAVEWGDSAITILNRRLAAQSTGEPTYVLTLFGESDQIADIEIYRSGSALPYDTLLIVRNEVALAAISLGRRMLYRYNLNAMTTLYRHLSSDPQLEQRCIRQAEINSRLHTYVWLLFVLAILVILVATYIIYRSHWAVSRNVEILADECQRVGMEASRIHVQNLLLDNSLSTIKHETMYYPSRIRQVLTSQGLVADASELLHYYQRLFTTFSQRAQHIAQPVPFRRQSLFAAAWLHELFPRSTVQGPDTILFHADSLMLRFMLLELTRGLDPASLIFTLQCCGSHVHLIIGSPQWSWSPEEQRVLFQPESLTLAPSSSDLSSAPFFFARTVLRLHDDQSPHHGCGIQATDSHTLLCILDGGSR